MEQGMRIERDGAVARIVIDRPDKGNMLTLKMVADLAETVTALGKDKTVKAIVLRTTGDEFCRGRDPAGAPEHGPTNALQMRATLPDPILAAYAAIRGAEVPVVAVVQGLANGFGCAIAGVCDVTIAAEEARFALPEMKADLPPTLAICAQLDRVPVKGLTWLVYSTDQIDAKTALSLGIVSRVVPRKDLDAEVGRFLTFLTSRNRDALATVKAYAAQARLMEPGPSATLAGNMISVMLASK
jgi:enoyl-CoA hydratase/carnithine racemase